MILNCKQLLNIVLQVAPNLFLVFCDGELLSAQNIGDEIDVQAEDDAVLLKVPAQVNLTKVVHLLFVTTQTAAVEAQQKLNIIVGAGSKVEFLAEHILWGKEHKCRDAIYRVSKYTNQMRKRQRQKVVSISISMRNNQRMLFIID